MVSFKALAFLALSTSAAVEAHMRLSWPPPLAGDNNPNTVNADAFLHYPYGCCGREVPGRCNGHLDLLNTDEGKPVVTWAPGQKVNFTLTGQKAQAKADNVVGGTHYGGSCQVGFSTDGGKTFKTATTWQGNCPLRKGDITPSSQVFDFTVPADLPAGERTIFIWNWINREQEKFETCASVTISGSNGGGDPDKEPESSPAPSSAPQQPSASAPPSAPSSASTSSARKGRPSKTQSSAPPANTGTGDKAQYTLEGCTCSCPYQTWSQACECYECDSPLTKRHLVERKALEMHNEAQRNAAKLNVPHRRAESVAWSSRPDMLLDIDFAGAACKSQGNPVELQFPNPGPDVVKGDGEYKLGTPSC
ncbi:unnamed protein product [Periconia digitata]|uniref:Lytic polysaccharide monooxygenase n=1 Tax=Periconia digitata TaxID=1303443 RepID=A0A9W4XLQ3_9PLEO|nr:unnamed protein product [Periconia digitata]